MLKIIIGLIIVVAVAGGGWWYMTNSSNNPAPAPLPAALVPSQTPIQPAATSTPGTPNTVIIPASGSTDSDLNQEAAEVDTQLNGLVSDNASADKGMNSQ